MKKYFLAVLALGATMMMACEPDNGENDAPETPADYTLSTDVVSEAYLENYGDDLEVGCNDFTLTLGAVDVNEETGSVIVKMLFIQFLGELSNTIGVGTYTPAQIDLVTGEGYAVNTYISAVEIAGDVVGSAYVEMNAATMEMVKEGIVDGDLHISKDGDNYVIKGLFTSLSGKTVKVDYTGAVEFEDYSQVGGVVTLLSAKENTSYIKRFSSVWNKRMIK